MSLITLRQALDEAKKENYALGGFNINNMEQIQAIMEAAQETKSPTIIQVSNGARKYTNDNFLRHMVLAANELYPDIPIVLHQDHGNSFKTCVSAIKLGFTSVMIDGSLMEDGKTPSTFEYNVELTKKVVDYAHDRGVSVEGELGLIGGIEDGQGADGDPMTHLTDPDQAVEFVEKTGIDALAVAIGTSHGVYKFDKEPDDKVLIIDRISEINEKLPNTHLVMHGSSSVPQELLQAINKYGGEIKPTWGVPISEIQEGIKNGVRKVNVDTDSRLAMTAAIRQYMIKNPEGFDPRGYLKEAREMMKSLIIQKMKDFGQAGHSSDYTPQSLEDSIEFYK